MLAASAIVTGFLLLVMPPALVLSILAMAWSAGAP
jgi:hypothetical protein